MLRQSVLRGVMVMFCYAFSVAGVSASPGDSDDTGVRQPLKSWGKTAFLEEERALIANKTLNLWGVALFSGSDLIGAGIRRITHSEHSHCGLVLVDQDSVQYCFESTGAADEILEQGILPEVQIHTFDVVRDGYSGGVTVRQFTFADGQGPDVAQLRSIVDRRLGESYSKDLSPLFRAIHEDNTTDNSSATNAPIFCSELVAEVLIELGYLPPADKRLANNYVPRDFCDKATGLELQKGATLGPDLVQKEFKGTCCAIL